MPDSYTAFLPWLIEHTPPGARVGDFNQALQSGARVGGNEIISGLARAYDPAPGVADPAMRLRAFGRYLAALGTMPPADFDALIRYQIMVVAGRRIEGLTRFVEQEGGQPAQWAEDCAAAATEAMRSLTEDPLLISDIPGATPEERYRRFQRILHRFGRLMDAWPALLEAAKDLRVAEPLA